LSFRSETAGQAPTFTPKFVDAYTAATLRNQARANDSLTPEFTQADIQAFKDGSDPYGHPNVDWRKTLLRPFSLMTTNTFNIQGGTDKAKYFVSAGYLWQNGMVKDFSSSDLNSNYYYKRYNFRSNMDLQATKDLLLSIDLSGVVSERNEPNILGRNNRNNVLFEIYDYAQLPPFAYALYNPDGSYGANPTNGGYSNNVIGRFALGGFNRSFDNDLTANLRATQKLNFITKGLSAKFVMGYNAHFRFWRSQTRSKFPAFAYNAANNTYTPFDVNVYDLEKINLGYYADGPNSYKKPNWQASLNYDRTFGGHHVNVLALINQSSDITGINSPIVLRSNVLRGTYDYKQRYLLEVTQTYSGSSKFDKANRFSWFPSYSLGWVVSQEQFFRNNVHFIDLLKLRGSWGRTASDNLGNDPTTNQPYLYAYIQNYTRGGSYSIADISRTITGIQEGTLGTTITWEKENQTDFGVDMTMFKGKLTFTADYFRRHRYDILIQRQSVSQILGVGVPPVNLGVVQNNGFEVELGYNGRINKVTYSVRANMSYAKNKILFQDEAQPTYPWLSRTGHPIGSHIGYTWVGFYQSYDEIAKSPTTPITARPGDLKYADLNGDGKIDPNDQSVLAYPNLPNTIIGFNGTVGYKGLTLAFTFQSALNFTMARPIPGNYTTRSLDAWTPENNVNPSRPRLSTVATVSGYNSTFWYKRMDYLRLKTIQLGYDLPKSWIGRLKLSNARIYTSGYNLFTFMLKGRNTYDYDPEAPEGTEGGDYPVQKIVNVGLQITF
jgi:TonB-linked SusC/RagA family outer membrane protein